MLNFNLINKKKQNYIILKNIYGISKKTAMNICYSLGLNPLAKATKLINVDIQKINYYIEKNIKTEVKLKYSIDTKIKNLIKLKNYKGKRHFFSLPVRGQRTRDNAKTAKKLNKLK